MNLNRLIIVGAGAIGGGIGGLLCEAGFPVVLVARGEHGARLQARGLHLKMPARSATVHPSCVQRIDQIDWHDGDVAMVATKLQDSEQVMEELLVTVGKEIPVVCASNGIHGEKWAVARFNFVLSLMLWLPATYLNIGEVRLHGSPIPGILDCGPIETAHPESLQTGTRLSKQLASVLRDASFESMIRPDIMRWKHAKWLTNLGSAAQALVTDNWPAVLDAAQAEGERILAKADLPHVSKQALLDRAAHVSVAPIAGEDRLGGSTWQSFRRGKPLETPWIEGAMADLAARCGIAAPINRFLAEAAKERRTLLAEEVLAAK